MISSLSKRHGTTLAGLLSLALGSIVVLCGAGSAPIENLLPQGAMQGDLNAGGHNLTNAATVYATNIVVSGSLSAPASFTLPFSNLTSTPTTLGGYGITDPIVLTSGSYANPAWLTSLAYTKLTGAPSLATVATSGAYSDLTGKPTLGSLASVSPGGTASSTTFLKYDGTNFSYATPPGMTTSGTALLYGNGSGGFSNATIGSGLAFSSGTLSANVTSVAGRTGAIVLTSADISGLATVATSGSYNDLTSKPTIPAAQVNSDWNASSGVAQILNKPALAASATTDTTSASNITSGTLAAARGGAGTVSGILKANGSGTVSQAVSGTDYDPATSGSSILAGNGSGGTQAATAAQGAALLSGGSGTMNLGSYTLSLTSGQIGTLPTGLNGVAFSGLGTGLLKNTTSTGVPVIAVAGSDYPPTSTAFATGSAYITEGASITWGLHGGTNPLTSNWGYDETTLPFFSGRLKTYTTSGTISSASGSTSVAGQTAYTALLTVASGTGISVGQEVTGSGGTGSIPSGSTVWYVSGTTVGLMTPGATAFTNGTISTVTFTNYINDAWPSAQTAAASNFGQTAVGNWSGSTNTIALTTSPGNVPAEGLVVSVSGTNIPVGDYGTLSGSTLTLYPSPTTGSGSSVTITLGGNNITDRFMAVIYPHRPTANGGDGGLNPWIELGADNVINDLANTVASSTIITNLTAYVSMAHSYGFKVAIHTVTPCTDTSAFEAGREAVNAAIRNGTTGADLVMDIGGQVITNYLSSTFFYSDELHLLATGQLAVASYANAAWFVGGNLENPNGFVFPETITANEGIYIVNNSGNGGLDISSSAGGYSMTHSGALTVASLYNYGTLNTGSVSLGAGKYVVWNNDAGLARDSVGTIGVENASYGAGYYDGLKAATLSLQQLASPPGSPTIGQAGTAGSTSYSYRVVAYMGDGSATTAGGTGSTSTGNATLSSSSYNTVTFTQVTGASSYGIYRTAAGGTGNSGTTGLVGTIAYNGFIFHDTGAAGDGTSPPVYNSTGVASVYGLSIASTQTTISGSSSGSAIFSEPDLGPSEKKAIIYCNALTGTASYTFPVAFTNTPVVVTTSGPAASVVTSLSTTAVTVTGSGTTGPILVEGY